MVKHEKTTTLSENVLELWGFIFFLFRASCCLGEPGSPEESDCGETDQKAGREPAQRRVSDGDDDDDDDGDDDDDDDDDGDGDDGDDDPTRSPVGKLCLPSDNLKVENF